MRKAFVVGLGVAAFALVGCNLVEKLKGGDKEGPTAASGVPPAAPGAAGATGLLGKALSFAGEAFSGEMDMEVRNGPPGSKAMTSTFKVKGTKMRIDSSAEEGGGLGTILVEPTEKKMTMLDPNSKTAMVMRVDVSGASGPSAGGAGGGAAAKKTEFKKTGKTDVVAGYACDLYAFDGDEPGETGEACVASGLSFLGMGGKLGGGWASSLPTLGGFPLRVVVLHAGTEKSRWEVKRIAKKDLPDSEFQVPPGYTVVDMDQMMKGIGAVGSGRVPVLHGNPPGIGR